MQTNIRPFAAILVLAAMLFPPGSHATSTETDVAVKLTRELASVDVVHEGRTVTVRRVQDTGNTINASFAKTSRKCPPFCIQPASIAPGVEVVGELEVLDYLQRRSAGDDSILVIDSRGSKWVAKGTIPGSINIHYKRLSLADAMEDDIAAILENQFGVLRLGEFWDFSNAKTLVLFCNGIWCGQSPSNIRSLLQLGYPAHKLKWYRGGMQAWETVGLTTVKPVE